MICVNLGGQNVSCFAPPLPTPRVLFVHGTVDMPYLVISLIGDLYFSGMWLGVNGYQQTRVNNTIALHARVMITNLGSIIDIMGGAIWPSNKHGN